jgi:hypothetical protein
MVSHRQAQVGAKGGDESEAKSCDDQSGKHAVDGVAGAQEEQLEGRPGEAESASLEDDAIEEAEHREQDKGHGGGSVTRRQAAAGC